MKRITPLLLVALFTLLTGSAFSQSMQTNLTEQGLLITLAGIFFGGLLVSLTPCVYPMIPITLSIIGARSAESKPIVGFTRSLVFVLGIATIYTVLGMIVALTGGTIGFMLQSKGFLLFMSVLFIVLGLSMLGMFNLQLPPAIASKLQGSGNRGGFFGAFLLGITTGVVASPCGSPVLVSILALAGKGGQPELGAVMLFTYALGIGMLFLVLGTFPAFLSKVPKSGVWMEDVKKFMGVVLIIASFYYLGLALPKMLVWGMLIATSLMFAAIIAIHSRDRDKWPRLLWAWRIAGVSLVALAMYASLVAVPALLETENARKSITASAAAIPAATGETTSTETLSAPPAEWLADEAAALRLATENSWPVIVDFGAEWCAACKELEHKTFPVPEVEKVLTNFVKIKIDATEETPEVTALQEKYGVMSLPHVAFIDAEGNRKDDLTLLEFEKPAEFLKRLEKVPAQ